MSTGIESPACRGASRWRSCGSRVEETRTTEGEGTRARSRSARPPGSVAIASTHRSARQRARTKSVHTGRSSGVQAAKNQQAAPLPGPAHARCKPRDWLGSSATNDRRRAPHRATPADSLRRARGAADETLTSADRNTFPLARYRCRRKAVRIRAVTELPPVGRPPAGGLFCGSESFLVDIYSRLDKLEG